MIPLKKRQALRLNTGLPHTPDTAEKARERVCEKQGKQHRRVAQTTIGGVSLGRPASHPRQHLET